MGSWCCLQAIPTRDTNHCLHQAPCIENIMTLAAHFSW